MKNIYFSRLAVIAIILIVSGCTFHIGPDPAPSSSGGTTGGGTSGSSSISFINPTFTNATITFNGTTKTIAPFGTETFTGTSGKSVTYHAEVAGKNSAGTVIGEKVNFDKTATFSSVPQTIYLDVPIDYYFLMIINTSGLTISKLYTNTGTSAAKTETVSFASGSSVINVGYYKAVSGANLKMEFTNGTSQTIPSLTFNNITNQTYTASVTGSGGGGGGTGGTATIVLNNTTFTDITITLNGETKTILTGSSVSYTGAPNATATYTGQTSGKTTTGSQVGLAISWSNTTTFPASGSKTINLQVSSDYFFVFVTNNSTVDLQKIYVNYQLTNQTLDNVVFAKGGTKYRVGYYRAFSNSNVRFESGTAFWSFTTLNLPFTVNQSVSLVTN